MTALNTGLTGLVNAPLHYNAILCRYMNSLYWSIMTMTTGKALCYRCDDTTDSAQSRRAFDMGD